MIAVRLIPRAEILKKLSPYGCRYIRTDNAGFELWETGWKEPFTLHPERDGVYDEWQYREILVKIIAGTMPPGWEGSGK